MPHSTARGWYSQMANTARPRRRHPTQLRYNPPPDTATATVPKPLSLFAKFMSSATKPPHSTQGDVGNVATRQCTTNTLPDALLELATELVGAELVEVNRTIHAHLQSDIPLINTLAAYLIDSGGKRLRPLIVLLCAHYCGYRGAAARVLAAVIEFIHSATLLHDDVVDASTTRRGRATANSVWGGDASVLVGDFLYSRAFQMMVELGEVRVMEILANTTNTIAEGEVMQLLQAHSPATTEAEYMATVQRKTAILFESAALLGAVLGEAAATTHTQLARYGLQLGIAFQLVDDILDYTADATLGKNLGDDLAQGKPTLPLIYALQHGTATQQESLRAILVAGDRDCINAVVEIVRDTGALDYARARATAEADLAIAALATLPVSPYRTALQQFAQFAVAREH